MQQQRLSYRNEVNSYYNCFRPTIGTGYWSLGCCLDVSIQDVSGRMCHAVEERSLVSIKSTQPNVPSSWTATEINDARKTRFSCDSAYWTYLTWCVTRAILRSELEPIAKTSHAEESVIYKVLGNPRTILLTLVRGFPLCHLDVNCIIKHGF
jgi:hypothetical protein